MQKIIAIFLAATLWGQDAAAVTGSVYDSSSTAATSISHSTPAGRESGSAITVTSGSAQQQDFVEAGPLVRVSPANTISHTLSTGLVLSLGVLGLIWIRRHVAAL